jgi:hypothetical protein
MSEMFWVWLAIGCLAVWAAGHDCDLWAMKRWVKRHKD